MWFSSMDDFISEVSVNSKFKRIDWNKNFLPTTAAVAWEWHCLANGWWNPAAASVYNTGTNLAFQALNDTIATAWWLQHGGNVSTDTKHIINASAFTAAATVAPCVLMLVDLLGFYRVTSTTVITAQTLDNTVTLPRYTTWAWVQAFMFANNATPLWAATPNLSIGYTNSAGTAARATPAVLPVGKTACPNGQILYSGTGAWKYGPFIPLQGWDSGIRSIQNVTISASYVSGEFSIGLCRPLFTLPITTLGVASERDLMNQVPSMPQIVDGANLVWLMYSGWATPVNSSIFWHLDVAWG
jgi:hypothetical protein